MQQFGEFVVNHWVLVLLFIVILGALIWTVVAGVVQGGIQVSPIQVTQLINRENAVVIDIRDQAEFSTGHILNAVNLSLKELQEGTRDFKKFRNRPVIISCRTGANAGKAAAILKKAGVEQVYRLKGGIAAWQNEKLPLAKR